MLDRSNPCHILHTYISNGPAGKRALPHPKSCHGPRGPSPCICFLIYVPTSPIQTASSQSLNRAASSLSINPITTYLPYPSSILHQPLQPSFHPFSTKPLILPILSPKTQPITNANPATLVHSSFTSPSEGENPPAVESVKEALGMKMKTSGEGSGSAFGDRGGDGGGRGGGWR